MLPVESAFKIYVDRDGNPLDEGYIYFGQVNQNPVTSPVQVYWDAAGTQPAVQPLRTQNGYIVRSGTPANVFVGVSYSQLVRDKKQRQVYFDPNSDNYSLAAMVSALSTTLTNFITSLASTTGSSLVGFLQRGASAILRTIQDKMYDRVSALDFMTQAQRDDVRAGTKTLDVTAALQAAINAHAEIKLPEGTYRLDSGLTIPNNRILQGAGAEKSILSFTHTGDGLVNANAINGSTAAHVYLRDFTVLCTNGANTGGGVVHVAGGYFYAEAIRMRGFKYGMIMDQSEICGVEKSIFEFNTTGGLWLVNGPAHTPGAGTLFTNRIVISSNQFNGNPIHLIDDGGVAHTIDSNNFNGSQTGIRLAGSLNCVISNNELEFCQNACIETATTTHLGVGVGQNIEPVIKSNFFIAATGRPAIILGGGTNCSIESNDMQSQGGGGAIYAITGVSSNTNLRSLSNRHVGFLGILDTFPTNYWQWDAERQQASFFTFHSPSRLVDALATYCPANNGGGAQISGIDLQANNGASAKVTYAAIRPAIFDNTAASEQGAVHIDLAKAGTITNIYRMKTGEFLPQPDNFLNLGNGSARWATVFAGTGAINTSDAREKEQGRSLSDKERAVALKIKAGLKAFKFRDSVAAKGDGARWHFGVYAQEVAAAFASEGLDATQYAMFCYDEWAAEPEELGKEGSVIRPAKPAGNRYGIRYDELLSFIIAAI